MRYLNNAFSLAMLSQHSRVALKAEQISLNAAHALSLGARSVVGHEVTRRLYEALLGCDIALDRASLHLSSGDELIVGQYTGPRLPEGAVELPAGAHVVWWHIRVE